MAEDEFSFFYTDSQDDDYKLAKYLQECEDCDAMWKENECERDLSFALELDKYLNEIERNGVVKNDIFTINGKKYTSLIDAELDVVDPTPDVWNLFRDFDQHFFNSVLVRNGVQLEWSKRMTHCAGVCQWNGCYCSIRLSTPLLTLRKRSDLIETLLHEMIHAYLFVTRERDSNQSHGPKFHEHMFRINKEAKTNITVYHDFHAEVAHYQTHIWRCDGPCRLRGPYYGYVRRANNRKPASYDYWWSKHEMACGGKFIKISEPKNDKSTSKISRSSGKVGVTAKKKNEKHFTPFSGQGFVLGTTDSRKNRRSESSAATQAATSSNANLDDFLISSFYENTVDDELVKSIDLDNLVKENERKGDLTPSVLKYFPVVSKKKEIEVLQID